MKPKLILICGPTGAGKTTYAVKLAQDLKATHFSIDEMMKTLFWMDAKKEPDANWAIERVLRCDTLAMSLSQQLYKNNQTVILDMGFSRIDQRQKFYDWAKANKFNYELHYLNGAPETRWDRVNDRNQNLTDKSIAVSREVFDWMETYFQKPTETELSGNNGKRI